MIKPVLAALFAALACSSLAAAQNRLEMRGTDELDQSLLTIDERRFLGQPIAEVELQGEAGRTRLAELADGRPLVLLLGYFACRGVCPTTMRNLAGAMRELRAPDHRVAVLSFDARDTFDDLAAVKDDLQPVPAGWHFGLLEEGAAKRLADSIGYRFFFSERDQAFVHPSALVFVSPEGRVMRYLYGVDPSPRDLALAITEAADRVHRLNDLVSMAKLVCYRYDPVRSRYVLHPAVLFGAAGLGLLAITGLLAARYKPGAPT